MDAKQFEILLSMHKDMAMMQADIAELKADVREHIRRTNIIETELKFIHRQIWLAHGGIALLGVIVAGVKLFM